METDKSLYRIALTQIKGIGVMHARSLMQATGDEEAIFKEDVRKLEAIPRISRELIREIRDPGVLKRAEEELKFAENNKLRLLFFTDEDYPQQLTQCIDAPILLYFRGNAGLNHPKTLSIVGTRNATRYGEDFCREFIEELADRIPDIQIVSGLAYGIDVCAHRAALKNNLSTVAVLAHGLDRIYPRMHRQTAVEMLQNGALITEFPSGTFPEKYNFLKRNRIVAGMANAVVVIESGEKGGSLSTADIANSYNREVFALPGRVGDKMSVGCNSLIFANKALILQSVDGFISHMRWGTGVKRPLPVQRELFHDLSGQEAVVFEKLRESGPIQINTLAIKINMPVSELSMILFELEMKNIAESQPGGVYRLA
ncbi:MAG: DNA-processing protein DprA [Proteiniphilum sp.]|jgi:DNA processing protein|nr:DNA-processing protein DprA [Proteiniphilum sp.]